MGALVEFDPGAFVHVAMGWLVTVVRTVRNFVAHQRGIDALPAGTPKLVSSACGRRPVPTTRRTSELVRIVAAIVFAVAPVRVPDALKVLARKLTR